ncbi:MULTISPECIES: class I adenylate-forming enzyme family protein [unclassified Mesorhizobium]|uniref:AMP-binding protein n=1 Tax=unclassified Mesorhizobium TaxID=325217 RepID=UPI001FDFB6F9|nr:MULTISPECIES: class I adenylate-forming enzyme family protein [unclassified Mesorhizobium]
MRSTRRSSRSSPPGSGPYARTRIANEFWPADTGGLRRPWRQGRDGQRPLTYAQALAQRGHLAANFGASGIGPGDRVGLAMVDNIDVVLSILACWKIGATPVVVDFRTPRSQRARQARDFGLKMVFESRAMPGDEAYPNALFDAGWKSASAPGFDANAAAMDDASPAFLIFSSGTTGDPEAYTQSHEALARRIAARRGVVEGTAKRFLTPMALSYSAMRHQVLGYLLYGAILAAMKGMARNARKIATNISTPCRTRMAF